MQHIVCLDMEGVLVPEIWIAFSEASGIPELKRTTRDEPDYIKLMNWRLDILRQHGLGLKEIQDTIATIDPLPGAREFLDELRETTQVIILSDTFTQFAQPLMKKLGFPMWWRWPSAPISVPSRKPRTSWRKSRLSRITWQPPAALPGTP